MIQTAKSPSCQLLLLLLLLLLQVGMPSHSSCTTVHNQQLPGRCFAHLCCQHDVLPLLALHPAANVPVCAALQQQQVDAAILDSAGVAAPT
jgi:hypothetical protein